MRHRWIGFVLLGLASFACSEATDGVTPDAGALAADSGSRVSEGEADDGSPSSDGGRPTTDATTSSSSVILVNEVSGEDEWIELVNSGTSAVDISGFSLADTSKEGGPKLEDAVTFPSGTILSPKAYVVVRGGGADAGKPCPEGPQSYCFFAEFGISNKKGETLYLLAKDGSTIGTVVYPPNGAPDGETWSRIPSGDPNGKFEAALPTPGAKNEPKAK